MPDTISSTKQERPYILLVAEENALRRSLQLDTSKNRLISA